MSLRSEAARGVGVLSRIGFDQRDELLEIAHRQRRIHRDKVGRRDRQRHRREILVGIERQLGKQRGVDDVGAKRNQQRVAVGRRPRRLRGAHVAGRAGDVLNIELLAEMVGELLRGKARENVGRAAGLERDDDAHRAARPRLGARAGGPGRERGRTRQETQTSPALHVHWESLARAAVAGYRVDVLSRALAVGRYDGPNVRATVPAGS
jgi:hypothetical protein